MHHCNIMYPSCDTIYTGVMLNVKILCVDLFSFLNAVFCFYQLLLYICETVSINILSDSLIILLDLQLI